MPWLPDCTRSHIWRGNRIPNNQCLASGWTEGMCSEAMEGTMDQWQPCHRRSHIKWEWCRDECDMQSRGSDTETKQRLSWKHFIFFMSLRQEKNTVIMGRPKRRASQQAVYVQKKGKGKAKKTKTKATKRGKQKASREHIA